MKKTIKNQINEITASGTVPTNVVSGTTQYFNNFGTVENVNIYVVNSVATGEAETESNNLFISILRIATKTINKTFIFIWKNWEAIIKITPLVMPSLLIYKEQLEILFHNLRI